MKRNRNIFFTRFLPVLAQASSEKLVPGIVVFEPNSSRTLTLTQYLVLGFRLHIRLNGVVVFISFVSDVELTII